MVVFDSSALIYFAKIGRLGLLRKLFKKIFIPSTVFEELVVQGRGKPGASEIEKACGHWIKVEEISADREVKELKQLCIRENLAQGDVELFLLARSLNKPLVTNDKALRLYSKAHGIETWWATTIVLKLVKKRFLSKALGKELLFQLVSAGMNVSAEIYAELLKEIDRL